MFDDEGSNNFPSTGMIMNAILKKQRELPWIFGKRMGKEGTADDGPSTTTEDKTLKDDTKKEIFKKIFGKEGTEEDTADDGSST